MRVGEVGGEVESGIEEDEDKLKLHQEFSSLLISLWKEGA